MATEISSSTSTLTQTPGIAVLSALAERLRQHAAGIANTAARRTIGRDLVAAADVIEQAVLRLSVQDAAAAAIVAYLGRNGAGAFDGRRA
jgi:hypothetical protein